MKDIVTLFSEQYSETLETQMPLQDYLLGCRDNPVIYALVAEHMLTAIGHKELVDTSKDSRRSPIFQNRTVKYYEAFKDFYDMEDTIERIIGYFRYAAQGLEKRKHILYLLGPVGGGKSSLAERLKRLVEEQPIYVLKAGDQSVRCSIRLWACSTRSEWPVPLQINMAFLGADCPDLCRPGH